MPPGQNKQHGRRSSTIRDVAALAGVSKSTASRAVAGQGGVSAENLEKILKAIEQLDFVPNQIARSLTARSSAVLGLFLRHTRAPFYAHLAGAFEESAAVKGYEVMSLASGDQPDEANYRSLMLMADLHTAGIVVATPNVDPRTIRQVASRVPLVLASQMGQPSNPGVPFVAPDPRDGGHLIEHLAGLGHTAIAVLALPAQHAPTQWARISWMRDELTRRGMLAGFEWIEPDQDLTEIVDSLYRSGATAIMAPSDWVAFDVLSATDRLGLSVPGDLSVTGYDGVPPFDHSVFGLTTYRIPVDEMAAAALKLLDDLIHDNPIGTSGVLLHGEMIVGRTTGPVPARKVADRIS
ncbi:LacI family DNA-binding transcriptional regulator [Leifsonia sp. LS1]|uniref:LacI family DNA-binding transcriptional regulator n=1 Tax=Leifsonia sp. LS1 TaxID=2828483 RepID=UPI001CFE4E4A|nr:LacI family DNA-binding transcriptional regulator [Leifsonia sp. LS1]